MTSAPDSLPDDIDALHAALAAERLARREAEARASGAEAMVAHLKLLIAKLKRDKFGASSERGRKLLDQLELELGELVAASGEDAAKAEGAAGKDASGGSTRSSAPSAPSTACRPSSAWPCAESASRRSSPSSKPGCARTAASCPATTR